MKIELARLAMQHDIVLDLHCDTECVPHIYAPRRQTDRARALGQIIGASAVLLEPDDAGGGAFDQTHAAAWSVLQARGLFSELDSGFSATIELRGQVDVSDELATVDAANLIRFFEFEGALTSGASRTEMHATQTNSYPLEGASHLPCPCAGIILYLKAPGDTVKSGEVIAEIVKLDGEQFNQRVPVHSNVDGVLVVRQLQRLVRAGQRAALVVGQDRLEERKAGKLFLDF